MRSLALFFTLADVKAFQFRKMGASPMTMPPTTVSSAVVKEEDWAPTLSAVGSISAVQGAVVSTELGGIVSEVGFQNGGEAKKGDVLLKLDSSAEEALLHTAEADLELARANLQRERDLAARKVVSKQELDAAESTFGQKQGTVDHMRAIITKKQVRAPFDGQLGIRQVNVGQMINAGQQVVSLQALDPVYVDFALPQQELSKLAPGLEALVRTDAQPGREFKGKLTATQFNGRLGHAECDFAGDVRKSRSRAEAGNVRQDRNRVAGKTQDAGHSGQRGFVCAIRRFSFRDR